MRLYRAQDGFEAQEFKRTASRLIEMRLAGSPTLAAFPPHSGRPLRP